MVGTYDPNDPHETVKDIVAAFTGLFCLAVLAYMPFDHMKEQALIERQRAEKTAVRRVLEDLGQERAFSISRTKPGTLPFIECELRGYDRHEKFFRYLEQKAMDEIHQGEGTTS